MSVSEDARREREYLPGRMMVSSWRMNVLSTPDLRMVPRTLILFVARVAHPDVLIVEVNADFAVEMPH